jgi:GTP-binding protein HflX
MPYSPPAPLRAALMAVQLPDVDDQAFAASIAEMVRLGRTLGVEVVATVTQRRRALAAGTVVGSGKLAELKALAGQTARAETPEDEDDAKDEDDEKDEDEDEDEEKDEDEDEDEDEDDGG